jgi:hypothetical protein
MEDALGPIGAGMIGVSIYMILKALWWAGDYEAPQPQEWLKPECVRRSTRIALKRLRED